MSSDLIQLSPVEFLQPVVARNTAADGTEKDPALLRRMENPICQKCMLQYRQKYPGLPFNIHCDGIYDERDYVEIQEKFKQENPGQDIPLTEIQEIYDVTFWAYKFSKVKDENGDYAPFSARDYQDESLRCTAKHVVHRWGRGTGKTITAVIKELHKVITRKRMDVMIVCPAQSQSQMWFELIKEQLENSDDLRDALQSKKQQPFHMFRFWNGSVLSIFTAGSKSGRGADSVRGQSPRRVRIDEQDYLAEKDYQAIMPLARRYRDSEFEGSSTPTGARTLYWQMCTKLSEYKEFYFPATVLPGWGPTLEQQCMAEAKTMDRYRHEFLAEFGDPESGVFKGVFVDAAREPYKYAELTYDPSLEYYMGVDWNGKGTGTRIRVLAYSPATSERRCVAKSTIDHPGYTYTDSVAEIIRLNRKWHCTDIFIDFGHGAAQDELLRLAGQKSNNRDDKRLTEVKTIDFGGSLTFNKLVSKRDPARLKYKPEKGEDEIERRTKPFMVEGSVMAFEQGLVKFSSTDDDVLNEQLRAYRVKNWSSHGYANTYESSEGAGDHDLDAFMLAMLAIESKHGIFHTPATIQRLASMILVPGWGVARSETLDSRPDSSGPVERAQKARRQLAGIPSRAEMPENPSNMRVVYAMRGGAYIAPEKSRTSSRQATTQRGAVSRTAMFRRAAPGGRSPMAGPASNRFGGRLI